jgi:hypothetical protein
MMKKIQLLLALTGLAITPILAQPAATPTFTQITNSIKVVPGKNNEFSKFMTETSVKMARQRVDAGEIATWILLRSVMPAGSEARADYMISTFYLGAPPPPRTREDTEKSLKQAGIAMSVEQYYSKRDSLSSLVSTEMWRPRVRVGASQKGHYLYLNMMKVHDAAGFDRFETDVQKPIFEERVKRGEMSGWSYATRLLPVGSDIPYNAYTADIFPSWDAAFKTMSSGADVFAKVHAGKNAQEVMSGMSKLRDHARRELWVVVERFDAKPKAAANASQ